VARLIPQLKCRASSHEIVILYSKPGINYTMKKSKPILNNDEELMYLFEDGPVPKNGKMTLPSDAFNEVCEQVNYPIELKSHTSIPVQWSSSDGKIFIPTSTTTLALTPGFYEIDANPQIGLYFEKIKVKTEGIINFPDTTTNIVISEIKKFWERENIFKDFGLAFKRGILLYGPPGGGKTCTLQLISRDVIKRNGIVIKFNNPGLFSQGMRKLREIQPEVPVVVLLEDMDSIIEHFSETEVINILDGVDKLDKIVYIATTNYPERLGDRIINRPSRFDKRFKVGFLSPESRKIYFEFLIDGRNLDIDINQWVSDTNDFSIAHLKELFVATIILGDKYENALKTLKSMNKVKVKSWDDGELKAGFRQKQDW
jgi:energy-coupling factor transporter ATP-binding protein EcfA2